MDRLEQTISAIDDANKLDPNIEDWEGNSYPKELLYSQRMTEMAFCYEDTPSEWLQIATRGHHIERWTIPRDSHPMDRKGYLKWRTALKMHHGHKLTEIMTNHGYSDQEAQQVADMVIKKKLKDDIATQKLEDIICLVFLKYYFAEFSNKHTEEKIKGILSKTWVKMSEKGQKMALELPFDTQSKALIHEVVNG